MGETGGWDKSATRRWQSRLAPPWQPRRGGSTRLDSVATLRQLSPRLRHQVCTLDALAAEVARARRRILLGDALDCTQSVLGELGNIGRIWAAQDCSSADEFGRPARSGLQDDLAWRTGKESLVRGNERMFMINGAASCVEVQGGVDGPAVLLVGSSMLSWPDELWKRLVAGGRRVIRYDVRDTGRSESYPPGEPGYSLADLVDDAVGVLDATATERAHVVGMSTGGWIAQLLALGHPERVATLTLIASRPNTPGPVDDDLPEHDDALMEVIMNTPDPDWSDERAVVDHLVLQARTFAGAGAFDEASARAHAEAEVARTTDVRCATTNIAFADHGPRWRERLGEIIAPTLVLHGEDDPFFPIGNGEALAAEIPDARLVRLDRVGHRLPAHAVPAVADELLAHTADDPADRATVEPRLVRTLIDP